jgi:tetratricopeptide (TPR) repeat protein
MAFIIGILGNLVAELFSSTGKFLFSDLTNKPEWEAWKAEHHLSKNDSDFLDRYGEALVLMKQAGKSAVLLKFFAEKNVVEIIHAHWYGTIEEEKFEKQFNDLAKWFTLDQQLENFSSAKEVFFFLTKFREAVHANRTTGEAQDYQILVRIENLLEEFRSTYQLERTDLFDKLFIFCNAADRTWVEKGLVQKLVAGGLQVHLDFREYRNGDYTGWCQKVLAARKTAIVFSKNFGKTEKWLLSGFLDEFDQKKLLPLRIDDTAVFEEFADFIDLSGGEASLQHLTRQLTAEFGIAPAPLPYSPLEEEYVNINALPHQGASDHLFGRQKELKMLDEAWDDPNVNVISFVAHGGVGKSALIARWVSDMAKDNYRGATRILATSFYSQGTTDRIASSDLWMNEALHWFGEKGFDTRSPWDKGKRLAQLVNEHRTLLLLDGLEPMQEGGQVGRGTVKDPALATLIRQLAKRNNGLLVITTREALGGFERFEKNMRSQNLETISDEAGKHILRFAGRRGINGSDIELVAAVQEFGNHAFAINLLGSYLYSLPSHPISAAFEIPDLSNIPVEKGKHPRRVIAVLADKLEKDGKIGALNILKYLGFFDRPVPQSIFEVLDENLIDPIAPLHELRKRKIIYDELIHAPDMVDCHPLVREHFMGILENDFPEIWQIGNEKLYRYYEALPEKLYGKYLPDTLEEMELLFRAVMHGCIAGFHQLVLDSIFLERIRRGTEAFDIRMLGALSSDLALLRCYFVDMWGKPVENLSKELIPYLFSWTGLCFRGLGQFEESEKAFLKAIKTHKFNKNWKEVSLNMSNLALVYCAFGNLQLAQTFSNESIQYADRGIDEIPKEDKRCFFAHILYQAGKIEEADKHFVEAEQMKRQRTPLRFFLTGFAGFAYFDFLLNNRKLEDLKNRATLIFNWEKEGDPLNFAFALLNIGKMYSKSIHTTLPKLDHESPQNYFDNSVEDLKKLNIQEFIPLALLARAAFYRNKKKWLLALEDLEEVLDIAEPSGMRLHLTDYHLEMSRLCLAMSEEQPEKIAEAKEHMELAAQLVEDTGYHRRDGEVAELREKLREK